MLWLTARRTPWSERFCLAVFCYPRWDSRALLWLIAAVVVVVSLLVGQEADRVYSEVIAVACQALPADHFFIGMFLVGHGRNLTRLGRYFESEAALLEGQTVLETVLGQGHRSTLSAVEALVHHYNQRGKEDEETSWQARLDARASAGGQE